MRSCAALARERAHVLANRLRAHRARRPPHARLHAEHAAPGARRSRRVLSRLPHLHRRRRSRAGPALHRLGGRARARGAAARPTSASSISCAALLLEPPARRRARPAGASAMRAFATQVPAVHRAGDRQGRRGHRVLPLQPPGVAQRRRRRPRRRSASPCRAFHGASADRAQHWPHTMLATSTHDNKRSEDVRARIDVLSEMPAAWRLTAAPLEPHEPRTQAPRSTARRRHRATTSTCCTRRWSAVCRPAPLQDAALAAYYRNASSSTCSRPCARPRSTRAGSSITTTYEAALSRIRARAAASRASSNLFLDDLRATQRTLAWFGHAQQPVA